MIFVYNNDSFVSYSTLALNSEYITLDFAHIILFDLNTGPYVTTRVRIEQYCVLMVNILLPNTFNCNSSKISKTKLYVKWIIIILLGVKTQTEYCSEGTETKVYFHIKSIREENFHNQTYTHANRYTKGSYICFIYVQTICSYFLMVSCLSTIFRW